LRGQYIFFSVVTNSICAMLSVNKIILTPSREVILCLAPLDEYGTNSGLNI